MIRNNIKYSKPFKNIHINILSSFKVFTRRHFLTHRIFDFNLNNFTASAKCYCCVIAGARCSLSMKHTDYKPKNCLTVDKPFFLNECIVKVYC